MHGVSSGGPVLWYGFFIEIDVGPLLLAGRPVSLDERVEVPPFSTFTFPQPAHVRLDLRRVDRGLQIDGTVERTSRACDRVWRTGRPLTVDVEERFDPPANSDPSAENNVLEQHRVRHGDMVRQVVTSALPFGLVCSPDAADIDTCGRSKNAGGGCDCPAVTEGDHGEPQVENPPLQDP